VRISKRYDELRKIQGEFAIQTPYLGGVEKEEQKVAPKGQNFRVINVGDITGNLDVAGNRAMKIGTAL
jgi:hypothetical protein